MPATPESCACGCTATRLRRPTTGLVAAGIHTGFGDEWVRIGGLKQFADGSISERTAWLSEPYIGIANYHGLQVTSRENFMKPRVRPMRRVSAGNPRQW